MQLKQKNKIIISAAGSRKTTFIVEDALSKKGISFIITYTNENYKSIRKRIIDLNGTIPERIKVIRWLPFLLSHWIKPYRNLLAENIPRIQGYFFPEVPNDYKKYLRRRRITKEDILEYYFYGKQVVSESASDLALVCNEKSEGKVIERLETLCDNLYFDEVQDCAGWDLELFPILFQSSISTTLVGDNRQRTYITNYSTKNSKYSGTNIIEKFQEWDSEGLCTLESRTECYRSNQAICNIADLIYPKMEKTISKNEDVTGHDGVFLIKVADLPKYIEEFKPQIMRYDRRTKVNYKSVINFGMSKGLTFERTLLFPTGKIKTALKGNDISECGAKAKFYVALTRAKHSVAIVYNGQTEIDGIIRYSYE